MTTALVRTAAQILADIAASGEAEEQRDTFLTAPTVRRMLGVDSVQLRGWVRGGLITEFRAATGHRRYLESEVRAAMETR